MDKGDQKHLSFNLKFFSEHLKADEVIKYTATQFPDTISEVEVTTLKSSSSAFWKTSKIIEKFKKKQDGLDRLYNVLEATGHPEVVLKKLNPKRFAKANAPTTDAESPESKLTSYDRSQASADGSLRKEQKDSSMVGGAGVGLGRQDVPRHRISDAPLLPARQKISLEKPDRTIWESSRQIRPETRGSTPRASSSMVRSEIRDSSFGHLPAIDKGIEVISRDQSSGHLPLIDKSLEVTGRGASALPQHTSNQDTPREVDAPRTSKPSTKYQKDTSDREIQEMIKEMGDKMTKGFQTVEKNFENMSVKISDMKEEISDVKKEIHDVRHELKKEISSVQVEVQAFSTHSNNVMKNLENINQILMSIQQVRDTQADLRKRIITLTEEFQKFKEGFKSLQDTVRELKGGKGNDKILKSLEERLGRLPNMDEGRMLNELKLLREDFNNFTESTNRELNSIEEQLRQGNLHYTGKTSSPSQKMHNYEQVPEHNMRVMRQIAHILKPITKLFASKVGVVFDGEYRKGVMDDEGMAMSVLNKWFRKKRIDEEDLPTWRELYELVRDIDGSIADELDSYRTNILV